MGELRRPGAMAAVRGRRGHRRRAGGRRRAGALCVAAVNGPDQVVISGAEDAVDRAVARAGRPGRRRTPAPGLARLPLPADGPGHSTRSPTAAEPWLRAAVGAAAEHGHRRVAPVSGPGLLARTPCGRCVSAPPWSGCSDEGYDTFVELGPGATLAGPVRAVAAGRGRAEPGRPGARVGGDPGTAPTPGRRCWRPWAGCGHAGRALDRAALGAGRARGRRADVSLPAPPLLAGSRSRAAPLLHRLAWGGRPADAAGPGPRGRSGWPARTRLARALATGSRRRGVRTAGRGPAGRRWPAPRSAVSSPVPAGSRTPPPAARRARTAPW